VKEEMTKEMKAEMTEEMKREMKAKMTEEMTEEMNKQIAEKQKIFIEDNFQMKHEIQNPTVVGGEYYVCGLAGDFCVRDTALNLKDHNPVSKVNVLHDFTRNAFVPLSVPLMGSSYDPTTRYGEVGLSVTHLKQKFNLKSEFVPTGFLSDIMTQTDEKKGLQHYIFDYDGQNNKYTIVSSGDLDNFKEEEIKKEKIKEKEDQYGNFKMDYSVLIHNDYTPRELFGSGAKYFHFVSDARQIVDDYANANIKLLTLAQLY
jgi:hypothetical protein